MAKIAAKFLASAQLIPRGSQVVIVSLVIVLGICLVGAMIFLYFRPLYSIPPFAICAILTILVVKFWSVSHKNIDALSSSPTSLTHYDRGRLTTFTTDPSTLRSPEGIDAFGRVLSMAQKRKPLPEPGGLVNAKGEPIPESNLEAVERIRLVNELVAEIKEGILQTSQDEIEEDEYEQRQFDHEPPEQISADKGED